MYSRSENVWKPESNYLVWNSTSHKFKASYPSTYTENDNVPAEQSTPELIATADYMLFPETSIDKSDQISLSMTRKTARVVIPVGDRDIMWKSQFAGYEIFSITISDGKTTEIKPCLYDGTYYALLLHTENEAPDATFMQITVWDGENEDTKEPLTIKGIPSHEAGKSYTYTLILGRDKVAFGDVTVANWGTGSILDTNVEGQTNEQEIADNGGGYCYVSSINTYFVYTSDGLKTVRDQVESNLSANITLMNNISIPLNIQGSLRYANWEPIGTSGHYNGIFNGNGKTITGLTINPAGNSSKSFCGLIQFLGQYGVVKDLTMENAQVIGTSYCGAVVGKNHGGLVSGCTVNNSEIQGGQGTRNSGGVVGSNSAPGETTKGGTIVGCSVNNSTLTNACGIVGLNEKEAKVIGCLANGLNLSVDGGAVSGDNSAQIIGCYAYQCKNGSSALVGDKNIYSSNTATVTDCYYTTWPDETTPATFGACGGTAAAWEQALAAMNASISSYGWQWSGTQETPTLGKGTSDSAQE